MIKKKCRGCDKVQGKSYDTFFKYKGKEYCKRCYDEIMATVCEHTNCSLERVNDLDYECEGYIKILMEEVCNDCGKKVGRHIDVFTYSHSESV